MAELELSERKERLLMALVERHIRSGEPVGSKTLAHGSGLQISPATVRNIMGELEELGVLGSPHTSSGRVPTELGYRLYVDSLLNAQALNHPDARGLRAELEGMLDAGESSRELADRASRALAEITRMAGLVAVPRREVTTLRQVEFLPLSGGRVLAILVVNRSEVHNRIIQGEREYSADELHQAANYINQTYGGLGIDAIRQGLVTTLQAQKDQLDSLMQTTVEVAGKALESSGDTDADYVLAGESNLLDMAHQDNIDKLKELFEAFNHKHDVLHLLEQAMQADGVSIFIGREAGYQAFEECSLVSAPYRLEHDGVGVLAVVGPTRMDYEKVIPTVDITARVLSAALNESV